MKKYIQQLIIIACLITLLIQPYKLKAAPSIINKPEVTANNSTLTVNGNATGALAVAVTINNANGDIVDFQTVSTDSIGDYVAIFTITTSGTYTATTSDYDSNTISTPSEAIQITVPKASSSVLEQTTQAETTNEETTKDNITETVSQSISDEDNSTSENGTGASTGDTNSFLLYIVLLALSLSLCATPLVQKEK
ncbi:hypothetical protein [Lachnospira multipara]|uniref:hypothetical protein n=1 Tax=Lachnospira multipara TaxID=28051 RepID=UPI0004E24274|nr:hypothetical protein [Lachnospira multipara]